MVYPAIAITSFYILAHVRLRFRLFTFVVNVFLVTHAKKQAIAKARSELWLLFR